MPEATLEAPPAPPASTSTVQEPLKVPSLGAMLDRLGLKGTEEAAPAAPPPAAPATEPPVKPAVVPVEPAVTVPDAPPESLFTSPEPKPPELFPEVPKENFKTDKAFVDYGKFRKAYADLQVENAKLKTAPKPAGDPDSAARIAQLEGRLGELSAVVERTNILEHPAIQQQIVFPRNAALKEAAQLLTDFGLEPNALERARRLQGKARIEALDEVNDSITSPTARMQLADLMFRIQGFDQQEVAMTADIQGTRQRLDLEERSHRHQAMQQQEKQLLGLVDMAVGQLRDQAGFEFLKEVDGNDKWNEGVNQTVEAARFLLTKNQDPSQLAAAAILAPLAVKYRAAYSTERTHRIALQKELAELKDADPGLGGGSSAAANGDALPENPTIPDLITKYLH